MNRFANHIESLSDAQLLELHKGLMNDCRQARAEGCVEEAYGLAQRVRQTMAAMRLRMQAA